jgi:hypothetical protein
MPLPVIGSNISRWHFDPLPAIKSLASGADAAALNSTPPPQSSRPNVLWLSFNHLPAQPLAYVSKLIEIEKAKQRHSTFGDLSAPR